MAVKKKGGCQETGGEESRAENSPDWRVQTTAALPRASPRRAKQSRAP